jgi:hypothetical protein
VESQAWLYVFLQGVNAWKNGNMHHRMISTSAGWKSTAATNAKMDGYLVSHAFLEASALGWS